MSRVFFFLVASLFCGQQLSCLVSAESFPEGCLPRVRRGFPIGKFPLNWSYTGGKATEPATFGAIRVCIKDAVTMPVCGEVDGPRQTLSLIGSDAFAPSTSPQIIDAKGCVTFSPCEVFDMATASGGSFEDIMVRLTVYGVTNRDVQKVGGMEVIFSKLVTYQLGTEVTGLPDFVTLMHYGLCTDDICDIVPKTLKSQWKLQQWTDPDRYSEAHCYSRSDYLAYGFPGKDGRTFIVLNGAESSSAVKVRQLADPCRPKVRDQLYMQDGFPVDWDIASGHVGGVQVCIPNNTLSLCDGDYPTPRIRVMLAKRGDEHWTPTWAAQPLGADGCATFTACDVMVADSLDDVVVVVEGLGVRVGRDSSRPQFTFSAVVPATVGTVVTNLPKFVTLIHDGYCDEKTCSVMVKSCKKRFDHFSAGLCLKNANGQSDKTYILLDDVKVGSSGMVFPHEDDSSQYKCPVA